MTRATLAVYTNPSDPSRDEEFNSWYNEVHLPDVLAVDGFVAATRYRVANAGIGGDGEPPHRYVALYEIESDDPQATLNALVAASPTLSDVLQMDPIPVMMLFEQVSERIVGGQPAGATSSGG